jgi:hypothetical protein
MPISVRTLGYSKHPIQVGFDDRMDARDVFLSSRFICELFDALVDVEEVSNLPARVMLPQISLFSRR